MLIHRLLKIKVIYLFFIFFCLVISNPSLSDQLIVTKTKNPTKIIDRYGNKFFIGKNYILKIGDYAVSRNENSYFIFEDIKICLGRNSSIKFNEISYKNNNVVIEHLRGSVFINNKNYRKLKIKLKVLDNFITKFNKIYVNQFNKNKFIFHSFSKISFKEKEKSHIKLKKNFSYKFDNVIAKTEIKNILNDPLITQCKLDKKNISNNKRNLFKCFTNGAKITCGYK